MYTTETIISTKTIELFYCSLGKPILMWGILFWSAALYGHRADLHFVSFVLPKIGSQSKLGVLFLTQCRQAEHQKPKQGTTKRGILITTFVDPTLEKCATTRRYPDQAQPQIEAISGQSQPTALSLKSITTIISLISSLLTYSTGFFTATVTVLHSNRYHLNGSDVPSQQAEETSYVQTNIRNSISVSGPRLLRYLCFKSYCTVRHNTAIKHLNSNDHN